MRLAWKALFYGLCVNLVLPMITAVLGVTPALVGKTQDMQDPSDMVGSWNWGGTGSLVGDIYSGLHFFWSINVPFIEGALQLLTNFDCPIEILDIIRLLWRFIWISFVVEFISGRHIMYD